MSTRLQYFRNYCIFFSNIPTTKERVDAQVDAEVVSMNFLAGICVLLIVTAYQ
jgi:hypothetical protein